MGAKAIKDLKSLIEKINIRSIFSTLPDNKKKY